MAGLDLEENKLTDREILIAIWRDMKSFQKNTIGLLKQVILALLAIVGASVGIEFIGTPPLIHMSVYLSWIGGIFLAGSLIMFWRNTSWIQRALRLVFSTFLLFSVVVRTFVYEAGVVPAPHWYVPTVDIFLTTLAILLIIIAWKGNGKEH